MLKFKKYENSDHLNVNKHKYDLYCNLTTSFKHKTKVIRFVILLISYQSFLYIFSDVFNKDKSNKNISFNKNVIGYFNKSSCNLLNIVNGL